MDTNQNAIEALERVLLAVEAELVDLHVEHLTTPDLPPPPVAAPPPPPPPAPAPAPRSSVAVLPPAPPKLPRPASPQPVPVASSVPFVERLLRFGGISLVVLAALFFVSTAISRGWIGPTAQLALATAGSLGLIASSFRLGDRRWRLTLAGGGVVAFFVSGIVGHLGLELLGQGAATAWLAAAIAGAFGLALHHRSEALGIIASPLFLTGTLLLMGDPGAGPHHPLVGGAIFAAALALLTRSRSWWSARMIGAASSATAITLGTLWFTFDEDIAGEDSFAALLVGLMTLAVLAATHARELTSIDGPVPPLAQLEARVFAALVPWTAWALSAGLWAIDAIGTTAGSAWVFLAVALTAGVVVWFGQSQLGSLMAMLHGLASLATATVGFALLLDGPALLAALLGQLVVTGVLAHRTKAVEAIIGAGLLAGVVGIWTATLLVDGALSLGLTASEAVVTALTVVVAAAGVWMVRNTESWARLWLLPWGGLLVWFAAVWQPAPQGQMWVSISWAVASVLLILGRNHWTGQNRLLHARTAITVALATLGMTGTKLFLVDLATVDVLWRAGLFLVVGGIFLRLAFVLPDLVDGEQEHLATPD